MNRNPVQGVSRRDELLERCQRERYELVVATAAARAMLPRARRMAHWVRAVSRLLRVIAASARSG